MRIIAGKWRGRRIEAPVGHTTRPTSDRAREGLFSMLTSRIGSFDGLRVADLFAGSGALGLEALSRGAAHCTFVERDPRAVAALRANLARLGGDGDVRAHAGSAVGPFDLVFADPPYGSGLAAETLASIEMAPGGWAAVETGRGETVTAPGFTVDAARTFGKPLVTLLRPCP